jgi:hypothetical protein
MAVNLFLDTDVTLSDALESQTQTQIDGSREVRNMGKIFASHFAESVRSRNRTLHEPP